MAEFFMPWWCFWSGSETLPKIFEDLKINVRIVPVFFFIIINTWTLNIPKLVVYLVWWKTVSIRINPSSDWSKLNGLILIEYSVWINPSWDWKLDCGLFRINSDSCFGFNRINFLPFFIKQDTKRFSDWFGIIRIGLDTDIGINRNRSDWLGMNSCSMLSPG